MTKATNEQIKESYARLHNIWKVGEELGLCGQSIWERLKRMGYVDEDKWTETQLDLLRQVYSVDSNTPININDLAKYIGKPKTSISRKARELGYTTSRTRKRTLEFCEECSKRQTEWLKHNPHPKGAYKTGKEIRTCPKCGRFFEEYPASTQVYCGVDCGHNHTQPQGHQGYSKSGKRADLNNQYFRSRYEANYARYLNFLIKQGSDIVSWEFEPDTFEFKKIKRGTRFYTPDFKVKFKDSHIEYHEVKGWDYPKGRTARKRFAKYYPQFKLVLIDSDWFKTIRKQGIDKLIPEWESAT
jgi:hypothetical protein